MDLKTIWSAGGANSALEFERQQAKIVAALCAMDADIVGLMELQNASPTDVSSPISALVAAVNAACGGYAAIETGPIGSDAIAVGAIYKPAKVQPVGETAVLDTQAFVNPNFSAVDKNRPALAQSFAELRTGEVLTVVVNHLKSKGSACTDSADPNDDDTLSGQGNCNGTRTLAAQVEAEWLATQPTGVDSDKVLILGDLNAYRNETPIQALEAAGYHDLIDLFSGADAYGYVFDGEWGYLDHALASEALLPYVVDAADWHINADEIRLFDYNSEYKPADFDSAFYRADAYRSSDHDPVVVAIELVAERLALDELTSFYRDAVRSGELSGKGRFRLWQSLNAYAFYAILVQAERAEARGLEHLICRKLQLSASLSDGHGRPSDLIEGAALATLNEMILSAADQRDCQ